MAGFRREEKLLLARVADLAETVLRSHISTVTDFYDPYHTGLIISELKKRVGLSYKNDGGYLGAERQRVVLYPDYMESGEADSMLGFIFIKGSFQGSKPSHRDFLGSLLGLGLKRGKLGDILVDEEGAQVVVDAEVLSYIMGSLSRVGKWEVSLEELHADQLEIAEVKVKELNATVSSLRLDSVGAAGFGVSRSKMADYISAERVNLNWQARNSVSQPVKEGDTISIRGRGRVEVAEVKGTSRSGRIFLTLKRYS